MLITNSFPLAQVKELIASEYPWFRELPGPEGRFLELLTGHWPMFSSPMISLSCSSISFHRRHPILSRLKPNFREFHFPTHFANRWALPLSCVP